MISRRVILTGAMMAPLLGLLGHGTARADQSLTFRVITGWGQVTLTPEAMAALRDAGATLYAIAPVIIGGNPATPTIWAPLKSGTFNQDITTVAGAVDGGIGLRAATTDTRATSISGSSSVQDTTAQGTLVLDQGTFTIGPLSTTIRQDAVITVEQGLPGLPSLAKVTAPIPVRATPEGIDLFAQIFGVAVFTAGMTVAQLTGQCLFLPTTG